MQQLHSEAQTIAPIIAQLAALLVNGRSISSGQYFPVAWATDGDGRVEVATDDLLQRASRLAPAYGNAEKRHHVTEADGSCGD